MEYGDCAGTLILGKAFNRSCIRAEWVNGRRGDVRARKKSKMWTFRCYFVYLSQKTGPKFIIGLLYLYRYVLISRPHLHKNIYCVACDSPQKTLS